VVTVQVTVVSDRPVEAVFAYLSDFENAVEWDAGTIACARAAGDGRVGTTYVTTARILGREAQLTYTVDDLLIDERVVMVGEHPSVTSTVRLEIMPRPAGSEVVYTATFAFKGAARLVGPALRIPLRRLADGTERTLTEALSRL
jgi:uncharacterized protein YndB with AHSA1/START domain